MLLIIWFVIFFVSLSFMLLGSSWFLESAEKFGVKIKMPMFIIGVVITGIGTSLPEIITGFFAITKNQTEILTANVVGSNIVNILFVLGLVAIINKRTELKQKINKTELLFLPLSSLLFISFALDSIITRPESFVLISMFIIYLLYGFKPDNFSFKKEKREIKEFARSQEIINKHGKISLKKVDFLKFILGIIFLITGSGYVVESIIEISTLLNIFPGILAVTVVAIGTSLPELIVSIRAGLMKKDDIAIGNIFGSNIFNILAVLGLPGIFSKLKIDKNNFVWESSFLMISTLFLMYIIYSKKINRWQGFIFLFLYLIFITKLIIN